MSSPTGQHKPGSQWWKKWRSAKASCSHPADPCCIYQPFPTRSTLYTSSSLSWYASYPGTTQPPQHLTGSNRHHNGVLALRYQQTIPDLLQLLGKVLPVKRTWKIRGDSGNGIDFLATLFNAGLGYRAINTACSALSSVLVLPNNIAFGSHPLVARFLKGVFELKPSLPQHSRIWDVEVVLQYLKTLGLASELDLKTLTRKTTMLLCLLTGQRCQTLTKLDINLMQILPDKIVFTVGEKLKTTRPGKHLEPIELISYNHDKTLCVVSHLQTYLAYTEPLRSQNSKLLISYAKPHKPMAISTVSKWAKAVLKEAGVDITCFSGNSARSASTSYSAQSGLPLKDILKAGGWSKAGIFARYYNKPVQANFGSHILAHFNNSST